MTWWNKKNAHPAQRGKATVKKVVKPLQKGKPAQPVKTVPGFHASKRSYTQIRVHIDPQVFAYMTSWGWHYAPNECAGFFRVSERVLTEGKPAVPYIDWAWVDRDAKMTAGHVESSTEGLTKFCREEKFDMMTVNGQWHTHPQFSTYWSGTDSNDQQNLIAELCAAKARWGTDFYFIVFNMGEWLIRRITIGDDGKVASWSEGNIILNNALVKSSQNGYYGGYYGNAYKTKTTHYNKTYSNGWNNQDAWKEHYVFDKTGRAYHRNSKAGKELVAQLKAEEEARKQDEQNNPQQQELKKLLAEGVEDNGYDSYDDGPMIVPHDPRLSKMVNGRFVIGENDRAFTCNQFPEYWRPMKKGHLNSRLQKEPVREYWQFMGSWSRRYSDYDQLFEGLRVEKYDFQLLSKRIDELFRCSIYMIIIERPWCWSTVTSLFTADPDKGEIEDTIEFLLTANNAQFMEWWRQENEEAIHLL
jgi:hypothetical protein